MAYDHLRLLESSLKFMPAGRQAGVDTWLDVLDAELPEPARNAEIAPLVPAIRRVLARRDLNPRLAAIFPAIDEQAQ